MNIDHAKYINDYEKYGFPIYSTRPELPTRQMTRMRTEIIGGFRVTPFRVPHNETECDGFLIKHEDIGNLLFITDAEMCPYDMSNVGINHVMVECNYAIDYLEVTDPNKAHVLCGHMELQTCKRFVRSIDSDNLKSIGLIHLSSVNADPVRFEKEIQDEFPGKKVWVAKKNTIIEL